MKAIRFAVRVGIRGHLEADSHHDVTLAKLGETAQALERAGLDAVFVAPVLIEINRPDGARETAADPYVALGACALNTEDVLLGCCPTPDDGRLPSMLAKVATGLDVVSGGRVVVVFASPVDALDRASHERLGEEIEIVRAMSRVIAPSFSGSSFRLEHAWNEPHLPDGLAIAMLLRGDGAIEQGESSEPDEANRAVDLAARFCDVVIVDVDGDRSSDHGVLASFGQRLRRAGRVRSSVQVLALFALGGTDDEVEVGEQIRRVLAEGFDGVVLDALGGSIDETFVDRVARLVNG